MSKGLFVVAASAVLALAAPALGQTYGGPGGWVSQYDRPGDYRCDAYWDAGDRDCGAGWRDQRRHTSEGAHAYSHGRTYRSGYGHGRPYGSGHYTYRQDWRDGPSVYPGAYGRPDLVYPGTGQVYGHGPGYAAGRDPGRIAWCRSQYRSYDPASGYYRAYSGRLIFCG